MKKFVLEFVRRGFIACGFGPLVLAIVYLVLQQESNLQTLSVNEVCLGIFSLSVLAFIAGGLNALYQMERLPLVAAILIHGGVLYVCYLTTYLLNDWLDRGTTPLLVFSGIFVLGYLIIWAIIYTITKNKTDKLNQALQEQQS